MRLRSVAGFQNMLGSKMLMMSLCIDPISYLPMPEFSRITEVRIPAARITS